MKWFDQLIERHARQLASTTSRRSFLSRVGAVVVGSTALPLLPVFRSAEAQADESDSGDPQSCDYWRYCAIDGFLCSCCGGTHNSCPPGTEMSPMTWLGTCEHPGDGKHYVISYNDCCGKVGCDACLCNRNERDRPPYRPQVSNDINWCLGTSSLIYNCSTAIVIGVSPEPS